MSKGVIASVLASVLFGVLFYYVTFLDPLNGEEIFGWRMLFTAPCVTVFLLAGREWSLVRDTLARIRIHPLIMLGIVACAVIIAAQQWLFMWAPMHGRAMEVSLGYFLMPLVLVVIGRIFYAERLTRWQVVATFLAAAGVTNEVVQVGLVSWEMLLVALGYPAYFVLRRQLRTDHLGGAWLEMHLVVPVALWFILTGPSSVAILKNQPEFLLLIPGLGVVSAVALTAYFLASRLLKFGLFGLLSYLEPVLLVFVALLLGEGIAPQQWLTYIPIWVAVGVLFVEGMSRILASRQAQRREVDDVPFSRADSVESAH